MESTEATGGGVHALRQIGSGSSGAGESTYLEVDVGAGGEDGAELGILLDGSPLAGSVLEHTTPQRLLLLRRPLLLRRTHLPRFASLPVLLAV